MNRRQIHTGMLAALATACAPATAPAPEGSPAPWDRARESGVEFRAVGQEPGWTIEIDTDGVIRYVGDYGNVRFDAPLPPATRDEAGATVYRARTTSHTLDVVIRTTRCEDTMSGEVFTHTVTVTADGTSLSGCGRILATGNVTGTYWRLVEVNGARAVATEGSREAHMRLNAENMRASGSTGCNTFGGPYTIDGSTIHFGPIASTKMACVETARSRQEQQLLEVLNAAHSFSVRADTLTLSSPHASARFVAEPLR